MTDQARDPNWREAVARIIEEHVYGERRGPNGGWIELVGVQEAAIAIVAALNAAPPAPEGRLTETLVQQRESDDCTVCAIAMATGLPYEQVMASARESVGGYRYQDRPGTMSPKGVLIDLGYDAKRLNRVAADGLRGRKAIVSLPSLNGYAGHHDVYWDGGAIRDPSNGATYPPDALDTIAPLWAVVLEAPPAPVQGDLEGVREARGELAEALAQELCHDQHGPSFWRTLSDIGRARYVKRTQAALDRAALATLTEKGQ